MSRFATIFKLTCVSFVVLAAYPSQAAVLKTNAFRSPYLPGEDRDNNPITDIDVEIITTVPDVVQITTLHNDGIPADPERTLNVSILYEKQNFLLEKSVAAWSGNGRGRSYQRTDVVIPENTLVNSYLVYLTPTADRLNYFGDITFDGEVLGIFKAYWSKGKGARDELIFSNDLFGLKNTTYNIGSILEPNNEFVGFEGNILSFDLNAGRGREAFRVITRAVPAPEPFTILGAVTALGFGASFKRKLSKK